MFVRRKRVKAKADRTQHGWSRLREAREEAEAGSTAFRLRGPTQVGTTPSAGFRAVIGVDGEATVGVVLVGLPR
jgi:hypothetical protein